MTGSGLPLAVGFDAGDGCKPGEVAVIDRHDDGGTSFGSVMRLERLLDGFVIG